MKYDPDYPATGCDGCGCILIIVIAIFLVGLVLKNRDKIDSWAPKIERVESGEAKNNKQ